MIYPPIESAPFEGSPVDFWAHLQGSSGVCLPAPISDYLPDRWCRKNWEYCALLVGPDEQKIFQREFFAKSGSRGKDRRSSRSGPLLYQYLPDDLQAGALIEVRSGDRSKADRYKRIFRKEGGFVWSWLAYRQEDVAGWDGGSNRYRFRRFYPWELVFPA